MKEQEPMNLAGSILLYLRKDNDDVLGFVLNVRGTIEQSHGDIFFFWIRVGQNFHEIEKSF